jgi:hypothetical protein
MSWLIFAIHSLSGRKSGHKDKQSFSAAETRAFQGYKVSPVLGVEEMDHPQC